VKDSELKITSEQVDPCQLRLTIEVPEKRVQGEMRKAARRIARQANIPGFRKGKAPYAVIAQRYGEAALRQDAIETLIDEAYKEALEQQEIMPYDSGSLEDMSVEPLSFTILLPMPPKIDLKDYQSVRVEAPTVEVTEEDIDRVVERLRYEYSMLEAVEGRGAEEGDVLNLTAVGHFEDETALIDWNEEEVDLDLESDHEPAPGFYEALVGMKPDESRTFTLEVEIEDQEEMVPTPVDFQVDLHLLSKRILPDVDDDLARTAGDFDNLDELRAQIKDQMVESREASSREAYLDDVFSAVIEQAEIDYPPVMLEEEMERTVERFGARIRQDLRLDLEAYLKMIDKTEDDLKSELHPQAERRLLQNLVMSELIDVEELTVSEDEIGERIDEIAATLGERAKDARSLLEQRSGQIANDLLVEKAINRFTAIARGEVTAEDDDEAEEPLVDVGDEDQPDVEEVSVENLPESEDGVPEPEEKGDDGEEKGD
jgi:trigger factor